MSADTDGYLRRYDDDLGGALELLVRDLLTGGLTAAEAETLTWQLAEWRLDWVSSEPGGATALAVAEDAQERVIENRAEHNWPVCPLSSKPSALVDRALPNRSLDMYGHRHTHRRIGHARRTAA